MTRPVFPVFAAEGKNTIFLLRLSELIFSRRSAFFYGILFDACLSVERRIRDLPEKRFPVVGTE